MKTALLLGAAVLAAIAIAVSLRHKPAPAANYFDRFDGQPTAQATDTPTTYAQPAQIAQTVAALPDAGMADLRARQALFQASEAENARHNDAIAAQTQAAQLARNAAAAAQEDAAAARDQQAKQAAEISDELERSRR
jgi:hypothetical protein